VEGSSLIIASLIFPKRVLLCVWRDSLILALARSEISAGRVKRAIPFRCSFQKCGIRWGLFEKMVSLFIRGKVLK
jgi:hypothetical protein